MDISVAIFVFNLKLFVYMFKKILERCVSNLYFMSKKMVTFGYLLKLSILDYIPEGDTSPQYTATSLNCCLSQNNYLSFLLIRHSICQRAQSIIRIKYEHFLGHHLRPLIGIRVRNTFRDPRHATQFSKC